ncbi:MAG: T9SS type A sorting domain-containing protein [Ignavibacteriaceae bacterium]|nr:T9SS type A sorting domain-containing protein [Ignavibacteriaceae bacterium]
MKLFYLLFIVVLIIFLDIPTRAQIIIAPGEEKVFTNDPATGGEGGDNGNFLFILDYDFDTGTKTIKAQANGIPAVSTGNGEAYALIYYDFEISETPTTHDNTIGAWIDYEVFWKGYQTLLGIATVSNTNAKIELVLVDRTTNQLIKNDVIHDYSLYQYSYDFLSGGFKLDTDVGVNNFAVVLRRGHQYRLHLKLTTKIWVDAVAQVDYMDGFAGAGDGRVELKRLFVKVGLDEKETLGKLAKIDSLESRIDTLEYKLEHHHHIYLTGRGVGQNNTEANTTLSIFDDGGTPGILPLVYNDTPGNNIPEDNINNKSVPDKFSLGQNYPNPFNPSTVISFAIPSQEFVTVKVYDILGRQVKVLMNETKPAGYYEINFNASELPSGTYIYEIRAGNFVKTKKMILLK